MGYDASRGLETASAHMKSDVPGELRADIDVYPREKSGLASLAHATDTACQSDADCRHAQVFGNKCSYIRENLMRVYQAVNMVVHVFTVVISVLCGCLYVNKQAVCVVAAVPPVCSLPYNLYNALFAQSVQLWEAIKT